MAPVRGPVRPATHSGWGYGRAIRPLTRNLVQAANLNRNTRRRSRVDHGIAQGVDRVSIAELHSTTPPIFGIEWRAKLSKAWARNERHRDVVRHNIPHRTRGTGTVGHGEGSLR